MATLETSARYLPLAIGLLMMGCFPQEVIDNEDYCANQDGNAYCARHNPANPYCAWGLGECPSDLEDGCVATMPSNQCYSPCGGASLTDDPNQQCEGYPDATTTATGSSTFAETTTSGDTTSGTTGEATTVDETTSLETETTSTTDPGETSSESTGTSGCTSDDECLSAAAPLCDLGTGTCVPCSTSATPDGACELFDPATPVCFEDACVACSGENPGACSGDTPGCLDNTCVECTAEVLDACTAEAPACGPDNTCVQCTADNDAACQGTTPRCDDTTNTCVPCTAHDQCEAACDLETGACLPDNAILHVDGDDPCSDSNPGTQAQPLCTLQAALDLVEAQGTVIVHAQTEGTLNIYAGASIDGTDVVALLAADGEPTPVVQGTSGAGLFITGGAVAYLQGIAIQDSDDDGLEVTSASRVHADNVLINSNDGVGVSVSADSSFHASVCRIIGNSESGIVVGDDGGPIEETGSGSDGSSGAGLGMRVLDSPNLRLVNCFVNAGVDAHAVEVHEGAADFLYTTLAGLLAVGEPSARALVCGTSSAVTARNSLFVAADSTYDEVACATMTATNCAAEMALGGSNVTLGNVVTMGQDAWFSNLSTGNLCLANPPEALLSAASWRSGDPTTDINGTLRPTQDGAADVAGADIPGDCE